MVAAPSSSPFISRLMVVADQAQLTQHLRRRYPAVEITAVPSYMSGIAELAHGPVHAIVAHVDPASAVLEKAVRGLRIAAGESVPMILCCAPQGEPAARRAMSAGATDYVIYPPERRELDELLTLESAGTQPAQTCRAFRLPGACPGPASPCRPATVPAACATRTAPACAYPT